MKKGKQGEGGGKPKVVFTQDQIEHVEKLASLLTKGQLCDYLGISEPTFRAIEARQAEVSFAYKKGRSRMKKGKQGEGGGKPKVVFTQDQSLSYGLGYESMNPRLSKI